VLLEKAAVAVVVVVELELELIQTHMAQKPMLRVEVGARFVAQPGWKRGGDVAVGTCKRVRAAWGRTCVVVVAAAVAAVAQAAATAGAGKATVVVAAAVATAAVVAAAGWRR